MIRTIRAVALLLLTILCLSPNNVLAATTAEVFDYINRYKLIAIEERVRTGIPASITLAQGLYESGFGGSELAVEANNHFGIKCKRTWRGESHYVEDDDYDANGKLIKSCFRKYPSAEESYRDHSDFLQNNPRYEELFLYAVSDYKSWAKGLKRCGYATNPKYADKLIELIERYDLYLYDQQTPQPENAVTVSTPVQSAQTVSQTEEGTYNTAVQIVENSPSAPAAYSVADYVRNSHQYAKKEINMTSTPVREKRAKVKTWKHKESSLSGNTTIASHRNISEPVPNQKEVLSAPAYDIEYYELTEKGQAEPAPQKRQTRYATPQRSGNFKIHYGKKRFNRRGK